MALKWFELVDAAGEALADVDYVSIDTAMAATLRKVVKAEYADSLLAGIAPSKLVVYANRAAMATRTPLLSDTQIERFGKTRASPLIVQVPPSDVPTTKRKWFQLVDAAGKALTKMHYVSVDVPFVAGLRDAVKTKNADSRHLAGIMASDLVIYANRSAMVAKTPLDEDVSIDSVGNSRQHPFIVQVPRGIPPFTVLENADLFTNECGSLMTWEVGVAHEIKLIHEFMEPLGGCTKKGTIFWRWEEQQLVALLMSGWFPETCSEKINVLAGKKSIVLGSPGVGKSTLLCLLAFYVVLNYKKNVLVYRRLLNTDIESALLYLGWEQDRVVYFSIPDCTPEEAIKIRKSMGASVSLWLDGFVYKNVPYGLGAFAVLATSQQVDLKSQAGEHAYCCLLPCWRRDDLFTLGRTLFRYDPLEMEDRFFYSGGSVRDFSALTVDVIEDMITHAVRKVNDPENLLSSAGFVSSGDGQVDRLRHTFLTNDVEEGVNPRDKLRREKYWEQVVDSELAVALLSMRMRSDALYRIFQWARRSDYASLAGCVFEMYSHYLAGDGMLKLFVSEYNPSSGYPEHFQPLPLQKGLAECSGRKDDYVKALTSWRDAKGKSYWVPKDRQFPNVDSIVKLAPKSAASKPSSTPSTTTAALAEKCDVAYLQITIAATHTIQSQSLVELNKIFKSPVSSTPGNTERDHLMEAVETETAATVDDAVAVPMDTDETEESPATTTTSDAVADMQPPIYIAVCPDEKACKQLTLTLNVTNSRRQCQLFVGYFEHASAALRLAAARNLISQAYLGVRAARKSSSQQQTLVSWKQADLDVNKWSKTATRADDKVFGLFVHPQLPEDVVVVHENAQFECYDDALTRVLDSSAMEDASEADGTVVWASLASSHRNPAKGLLLLSLLVQSSSDASQHELMVFRIVPSKERRDARVAATLLARHSLPASCHGAIASCAFHAETLSYSVVLASGEWHMVYFRHDAMSSSIEFTTVKKITTFSPDLSEEDDSTSPVQKRRKLSNAGSASSSSAQFVAGGVGPFSYLVVASPLVPQKLIGWDSKFGVQVVSAEVKADKDGDASVPLPTNIGHIRSLVSSLHGETVVAAYDHAVFLLHVKNKHSTLASVLGVYTNTTKRNVVDTPALPNSAINWGDVASDKVDLDQWHHTLCSDDVHEQQLISELVEATAKISTASFQKKFDAAVQKLGGMEELSYRFLMATTRRCLESADKVPLWGPLKTLIETKRLSSRALPSLLPTLMKHSQFELLELAITHLADLDERAIVRLLRFFIRKSETKALASYVHKKITTSTTTPSERFIVALLGLPTNSVFLHHAIRELQLSEVLLLLAVCKKFFYGIEHTALVDDVSAFFTPLPSATQFCAWICALLDAHVSQLVLTASKETKVAAALEQLDAIVQTQLASCDRFEGVQSVLGNFLSGMNLAQAHGIPDYSIKEFTF